MSIRRVLYNLGIGEKFDWRFFIQSIIVISALVLSVWSLYDYCTEFGFSLIEFIFKRQFPIFNIINIIILFLLIVCSFSNNKKNYFLDALILYELYLILGISFDLIMSLLIAISSLLFACFLTALNKENYKNAGYFIVGITIFGIIFSIYSVYLDSWLFDFRFIMVPISIAATFFVRYKEYNSEK